MARIASLTGTLTLDSAQFDARLNASNRKLDTAAAGMQRNLQNVDRGFNKLSGTTGVVERSITSLARSILPVIGVAGIGAMLKQALDTAGALGELSEQLGISTDLIQSLRYNAAQSGVEAGELDTAIQKLGRSIGEAASGNKTYLDTFNTLGVGVLNANGQIRSTEEVLRDVSDALARLPDKATRSRLEVELFGRAGQQLAPILEHGSAQIDAFTEAARKAGVILDDETIKAADAASDKIAALGIKFDVFWQKIAGGLAGPGSGFLDWLNAITNPADPGKGIGGGQPVTILVKNRLDSAIKDLAEAQKDLNAELAAAPEDQNLDRLTTFQNRVDRATKRVEELRAALSKTFTPQNFPEDKGEMGRRRLLPVSAPDVTSNPPATGSTGKSQAQKDEEEAAKMIADLQRQLGDIGKTPIDTKVSEALAKIGQASAESKTQVAELIREIQRATLSDDEFARVQAADAEAVAKWTAEMEKGKSVAEGLRSPIEVYRDRVAELNQLHRDGAIDGVTWAHGLADAKTTLEDAADGTERYSSAIADLGGTFGSAFEEAALGMDQATSAAEAASDALQGLLKDIERIILRLSVTDPITEGLTGLLKGVNWGDLFFGSGTNAAGFRMTGAGPGASGNTNTGGGFFDWIGSIFGFHGGGRGASEASFTRFEPAHLWAGAPKLHTGSLKSNEFRAILQKDETVLTPQQMAQLGPRDGGGSGTVVNIIDQRQSGQVEQRESTGSNGQKQIDIMILDSFNRLAGRGQLDKPLGLNYGVKRQPGRSS